MKLTIEQWTHFAMDFVFFIPRDISESILKNNSLNIELFCMQASELKSAQSEVSSSRNLMQMTYVWNVCNLLDFVNIHAIIILSTKFPSQSDLVQFVLNLAPRGYKGSTPGYSRLFNCASVDDESSLQLLINYTITVRDLRGGVIVKLHGPFSNFYSSKTDFCWGLVNAIMYK